MGKHAHIQYVYNFYRMSAFELQIMASKTEGQILFLNTNLKVIVKINLNPFPSDCSVVLGPYSGIVAAASMNFTYLK